MSGFFNPENSFFKTMSKIWDMIVISIIWTICCIPLYFVVSMVTAPIDSLVQFLIFMAADAVCMIPVGPAMAAIYYVNVKVIRRERGYAIREYFHAYKLNFKAGAITGAMLGAFITLLSFDFQYAYAQMEAGIKMGQFLLIGSLSISLILLGLVLMLYPVLSRFTMTIKQLLKSSLYMAFRHIPSTLLVLVIVLASAVSLYVIIPAVFIIPSLCALLCSFPIERVMKRYMPRPEQTVAADGDLISDKDVISQSDDGEKKDLWYLE